jgi:penicillin-binding protein 1A
MNILKKLFFMLLAISIIVPLSILYYYASSYEYETKKLVEYTPRLTTQIFDKNGEKIANIFDQEHRYYAPFKEIPPRLIEALLAIEDTIFFEHHGINPDAILRAIIKDIKAGKLVEGASTITQQLVKNTLLTREKKFSRKIKEIIYSFKIEFELSKEQILERYLNEIYLGHGYYGVKTAAEGYFRKKIGDLTLKEIAILVGLPKAPSFYAPTKNYELSLGRANRVIARMYELGWINEATYLEATNEKPIVYDDTLTQNRAPYVVDEVLKAIPKNILDIKTGGYNIYTTIDMALQESGVKALKLGYELSLDRAQSNLKEGQTLSEKHTSNLNGALVSIDSQNGEILALVGGIDYDQSSYNRATMGSRLPGSAFKPFLYQVAIDLGFSGATLLNDIPKTFQFRVGGELITWQPKNYEKDYKGLIALREALVHSRNLATINLVTDIGLRTMINELQRYGIKNLPNNLSLALGTVSLSPLELAKFYSSFANNGVQVEPYLIKKIDNRQSVIFESEPTFKQITTPEQNFLLTSILKDVVKKGTGRSVYLDEIEIAGKTGTTNNNVDAWFAGYSPTVATVVWYGNDDNTPMQRLETGGRAAGPAFKAYYSDLIKLHPEIKRTFDIPNGVFSIKIKGENEYFTNSSKPPLEQKSVTNESELLF